MAKNQALTWEDIMSKQLTGGTENWDVEEDSQSTVEPQFEDATVDEEDEEQVVIESVMEEELVQPMAEEPLTRELGRRYHRHYKSRHDANSHWRGQLIISICLPTCNL